MLKGASWGGSGILSGCFPGASHQLGGDPEAEPELAGGTIHTIRSWKALLGKRRSGIPFSAWHLRSSTPDKQKRMDGWIWIAATLCECCIFHISYCILHKGSQLGIPSVCFQSWESERETWGDLKSWACQMPIPSQHFLHLYWPISV